MERLEKIIDLALGAAESVLSDGAETYRVEETIATVFRAYGMSDYDSHVMPTGIVLFVKAPDGTTLTRIHRVRTRATNLGRLADVVSFTRELESISPEEALQRLEAIRKSTAFSSLTLAVAAGLMCGFFSVLFGGSMRDFLVSFSIGFLTRLLANSLSTIHLTEFFTNMVGGAFAALVAMGASHMFADLHQDKIIAGAILLMTPGLAFTNAIRDTIAGDLVAGGARAMESLVNTFGIAFGTGMGMLVARFLGAV